MPLFYQQNINESTRLAIWKIEEPEDFFRVVPLQSDITHPNKRLQHLAGRFLLPYLYADFPHNEIEIATTRKPFLPGEQYHFSISHCGNIAAAIVSSDQRVGVDVEFVTPRVEKIKNKFLHAEELQFVHSQPPHHQLNFLSILWSAKEAMFKWYGSGEVNFSETMRTYPFQLQAEGLINAYFIKPDLQKKITLHYKLMEELVLVWTASGS